MYRLALIGLAATPLVHAQFNLLQQRGNTEECCPCPGSGSQQEASMTTVTVTAAPETTTCYVTEAAQTVYITKGHEEVVTVTIDSQPSSESESSVPKTITVTQVPSIPSDDAKQRDGPKTVVVNVTHGPSKNDTPQKTITVEVQAPPKKSANVKVSQHDTGHDASKTDGLEIEQGPYKTVTIKPEPEVGVVTQVNNVNPQPTEDCETTTNPSDDRIVTKTRDVEQYHTVTSTLAADHGNDNVIIIITNPSTGKSSCHKKKSGKPCHVDVDLNTHTKDPLPVETSSPSESTCDPIEVRTSIATVYNTTLVTVNTGMAHNATGIQGMAQPTGGALRARIPRGPLSLRW